MPTPVFQRLCLWMILLGLSVVLAGKNATQPSAVIREKISLPLTFSVPQAVLRDVDFTAKISLPSLTNGSVFPPDLHYKVEEVGGGVLANGNVSTLQRSGELTTEGRIEVTGLRLSSLGSSQLTVSVKGRGDRVEYTAHATASTFCIPAVFSLLPPVCTLVIAVVIGQVMVALLVGIFMGATLLNSCNVGTGLLRTFDTYWVGAMADKEHASILLFTFFIAGLIAVVQKGGGTHGLAGLMHPLVKGHRRAQLVAWFMCLIVFFDDYSCILIVGSSLRDILANEGVSHEKFAFMIHFMGVSLASSAPISSWTGVEVGYISAQVKSLGLDMDPFMTLLSSLKYRYYSILAVVFILLTVAMGRDLSAMARCQGKALKAIQNARRKHSFSSNESELLVNEMPQELDPKPGAPHRWYNAVVPFLFVVVATFLGMILDGMSTFRNLNPDKPITLSLALSHCDSVAALIRSSAGGWLLAVALLVVQRILSVHEALDASIYGMRDVLEPQFILILAWGLGMVITELNTASYVASVLGSNLPDYSLPAISLLVSSLVAFGTGSGFGTMGILFPLLSPLVWEISGGNTELLVQSFSSIMAGAAFGNCCSPIADTSILASLATEIPLQDHLVTIMPYALLLIASSFVFGAVPVGFGLFGPVAAIAVNGLFLALVLLALGKKTDENEQEQEHDARESGDREDQLAARERGEGKVEEDQDLHHRLHHREGATAARNNSKSRTGGRHATGHAQEGERTPLLHP